MYILYRLSYSQCVNRRQWKPLLGIIHFALSVYMCFNLQVQPLLKVASLCSAQDRDLLTQLPQQLHVALKQEKYPSILSTNYFSTQCSPLYRCERMRHLNWLWKNFHINVLELMTASIAIKDFKISNVCLLFEIDETTRFAINKWRSSCKDKN